MSKKRTDGRTGRGRFSAGTSGNPKGRPRLDTRDEKRPSVTDPRFDVGVLLGSPAMLQHRARLMPQTRKDDWRNPTTGQGVGGRDKRMAGFFAPSTLSFDQLREVWEGDDLAAVAVESIPKQARRPGYDISISDAEGSTDEGDLASALATRLKQLGADEHIETAGMYARAYGGGVVMLGVNDKQADLTQPLVLNNTVSLDWLTTLEARECIPLYAYGDPRAPRYGHPEIYQITSRTVLPSRNGNYGASTLNIHESRLLVFDGIRVSRYQNTVARAGWGESILVRIWRVLRDFNTAWANAGVLISDFAQTVIKMAGLWSSLAADSESAFEDRIAAMDYGRSTINAITIDAQDDYVRQTGSLAGLPDLLEKFAVRLAAACGMPLTLLFGTSPAGMNATGESDIRSFYDRVDEYRQHRIDPALRRIIQILFRTLGNKKEPFKWGIDYRPLWQAEPKEISAAMLTQAQADTAWITAGVLSAEEVAHAHWSTGKYNPQIKIDFSARDAQEQTASSPVRPDDLAAMGRGPAPEPTDPSPITDPDRLPPTDAGDPDDVNAEVDEPVVNEDDSPTPRKKVNTRADFDPDQARDSNGRWGSEGSLSKQIKAAQKEAGVTAANVVGTKIKTLMTAGRHAEAEALVDKWKTGTLGTKQSITPKATQTAVPKTIVQAPVPLEVKSAAKELAIKPLPKTSNEAATFDKDANKRTPEEIAKVHETFINAKKEYENVGAADQFEKRFGDPVRTGDHSGKMVLPAQLQVPEDRRTPDHFQYLREQARFRENLSPMAFRGFREYQGDEYTQYQNHLRSGAPVSAYMKDDIGHMVTALRSDAAKRDSDLVTFRGANVPADHPMANMQVGGHFVDKGVTSTSFKEDHSEKFLKGSGQPVKFTVLSRAGTHVAPIAANSADTAEGEYIHAPGTRFTVSNVERMSDGVIHYHVIAEN